MKVLVVKLAAIGDVVMCLSLVPAIKNRFPKARITWMCGRTVTPLLKAVKGVDEVIPVDETALFQDRFKAGLLELVRIWTRMAGRRFDLIITGNPSPGYRLLSLTARAGRRAGFHRGRGRQWPVPGRYHGREYARLAVGGDGPGTEPPQWPELDLPPCPELDPRIENNGTPLVALFPGGARNLLNDDALRRWPLESYARLGQNLLSEKFRVVILGGPSDLWVGPAFKDLEVIDLIGQTSLLELTSIIGRCDLVVSHDTAAVHLAGLMKTPVLALFGPTNPREKVSPAAPGQIIWGGENLDCRPCYDGRYFHDCRDNRCMGDIDVNLVAGTARAMLLGPDQADKAGRSVILTLAG